MLKVKNNFNKQQKQKINNDIKMILLQLYRQT
jgi:hypothetical protein